MKIRILWAGLLLAIFATVRAQAQPEPVDQRAPEELPPPEMMEAPPVRPQEGLQPPPPVQRFFEILKEKNPEEFERLKQLRKDDPEAFRKELTDRLRTELERRGLYGEAGDGGPFRQGKGFKGEPGGRHFHADGDVEGWAVQSPELEQLEVKTRQLAHAIRDSNSPEEQAKLREELKGELTKEFDLREQMRKDRLAQMEKRVEKIKTIMEQRQAQRDAIIQRRMEELTEQDALAW